MMDYLWSAINGLAAFCGITGITGTSVLGWILGGTPPVSGHVPGASVQAMPGPPGQEAPLTLAEEIRELIYSRIMLPDMTKVAHIPIIIGSLAALSFALYLAIQALIEPAIVTVSQFVILTWIVPCVFVVICGCWVILAVARLRWRIRLDDDIRRSMR